MTIVGVSDTRVVISTGELVQFGPSKALRWQAGTLTDLTPTAQSSYAATINRRGDIAGSAYLLPGSDDKQNFLHLNRTLNVVTGLRNGYSSYLTLHPTQAKLSGSFTAADGTVRPCTFSVA